MNKICHTKKVFLMIWSGISLTMDMAWLFQTMRHFPAMKDGSIRNWIKGFGWINKNGLQYVSGVCSVEMWPSTFWTSCVLGFMIAVVCKIWSEYLSNGTQKRNWITSRCPRFHVQCSRYLHVWNVSIGLPRERFIITLTHKNRRCYLLPLSPDVDVWS